MDGEVFKIWTKNVENRLAKARHNIKDKKYNEAVFLSSSAARTALYILFPMAAVLPIGEMVKRIDVPEEIITLAEKLSSYDTIPKEISAKEAEEVLKISEQLANWAKSKLDSS